MIKTENEITTVLCGKHGKPSIITGIECNSLVIYQIANAPKGATYGDKCTIDNAQEKPKVVIEFSDPQSIDVFINKLIQLKDTMNSFRHWSLQS